MGDAPQNLPFLFAAFAVVWLVFFAYAAYVSWKRQAIQRDLVDFSEELRGAPRNTSGSGNS